MRKQIDQDELNEWSLKYEQEKDEIKRLELKYQILEKITPIVVDAIFQGIATLTDRNFKKMVEEITRPMEEKLESLAVDYLNYETVLREPFGVLAELTVLANYVEAIDETLEMSLAPFLDNKKVLQRILTLLYVREIGFGMFFASFRPFFDTLDIAEKVLGVDEHWITAILALNIEENLLKKKLYNLGSSKEEINRLGKQGYYRLVDEVVKCIQEKEDRQANLDVLLSQGYRKVRNMIDHEGYQWKPDKKDGFRIVGHLISLAKNLWPQKQIEENK